MVRDPKLGGVFEVACGKLTSARGAQGAVSRVVGQTAGSKRRRELEAVQLNRGVREPFWVWKVSETTEYYPVENVVNKE